MVLSARHRARRSAVPKARTQQFMDMPPDILLEVGALCESDHSKRIITTVLGLDLPSPGAFGSSPSRQDYQGIA